MAFEDIAKSYPTKIHPLHINGADIGGKRFEDIAINDVVVSHTRAEQTIDTIVSINGAAYPHKIRGDGMLVSTFLGSTGYNASAMVSSRLMAKTSCSSPRL
jgi:NAD kinase